MTIIDPQVLAASRQSALAQWLSLLKSYMFQAMTVRADRLG